MMYKNKLLQIVRELNRINNIIQNKYLSYRNLNLKDLICEDKYNEQLVKNILFNIKLYKNLLEIYKKELINISDQKLYENLVNSFYKTKNGTLALSEKNPIFSSVHHLKTLKKYFEKIEEYEKCNIIQSRIIELSA